MKRRTLLKRLGAAVLAAPLAQAWGEAARPARLRLGYQKGSIALVLAKEHRLLERAYPEVTLDWLEFAAGPQMLEALNLGRLDVASTGDLPPLFAQAAGADLVYIGAEPAKPRAETLLVPAGSPLQGVAELKGKRIGLQKGSSSHNLVLRLLQREGLAFSDIQPVYLAPADANAAFSQGSLDAWAIWDPYAALVLHQGQARLLADGTGLGLNGPLYTARRDYARAHGAFLTDLLAQLSQAEALTRSDREGSLDILVRLMGLDRQVVADYLDHRPPSPIGPITPEIMAAQQRTADLFVSNGLLPRKVEVKAALI
ncbi:aliphatic sulfonate ABC transporter substrate-binding protein [Pseudomonas oryzihabitans]|uniref:aliphatic sulfonate ABC transporter substrate-binding protein n=1 Tax=Pseudomonas oryzihabitans TaxID=47885 RepID=UPI002857ED91|nr:aliphatic sulfonate ABC transporter substrate-binding protein [Pseudomonas psychrotolerans]MDR6677614.1 sulfonate transport system substrate-binding protein [Pseudomonas psychrotolerans]